MRIEKCRLCASDSLESILDLGSVPLANGGGEGPLELLLCESCSFVQLAHTVEPDRMFMDYFYESGISNTMTQHLRGIVDEGISMLGRRPSAVIDIGANDGTLLDFYDASTIRLGFEPCDRIGVIAAEKGHTIVPDYFCAIDALDAGVKRADLITAIAMFYDLDDPRPFLRDVRKLLANDGLFCLQMNSLEAMLSQNSFDNICHEHIGYYSWGVLRDLLISEGLYPISLSSHDINGGSMRVWCQREPSLASDELLSTPIEPIPLSALSSFADRIESIREAARAFVSYHQYTTRFHLLGASTRGSTLLGYFGLGSIFEACSERNPKRVGQTTAFGVPIISEEESRALNPDYYWVGPWWFGEEIQKREREAGFEGGLIFPLPTFRVSMP